MIAESKRFQQRAAPERPPFSLFVLTLSLERYWLVAAVGIVFALGVALATLTWQALTAEQAQQAEHLRLCARALVAPLSERIKELRSQLEAWSRDPRLRTAFEYADQTNLSAEETALKRRIPGALAVQLIRVESGASGPRLPASEERRLSYAGVDLARAVIQHGTITALEAHRVNQTDEHLALAGPVLGSDDQTVIGVIHLMLPLSLLPAPVPELATVGQFRFEQTIGDRAVTLAPKRAPDPSTTATIHRLEVPQTRIRLLAWREPARTGHSSLPLAAALSAGVGLVLAALVLAGAALAQQRQLAREVAHLDALATAIAAQQPVSAVPPLSRALQPLLATLTRLAAAPPVAATPSPDESASIMAPLPDESSVRAAAADELTSLEVPLPSSGPSQTVVSPTPSPAAARPAGAAERLGTVPARVFRPHDIRGLVGTEINEEFMRLLGRAVGSESQEQRSDAILLGRDNRPSSAALAAALSEGLRASGCAVIDLGILPLPVLYFACNLAGGISGAMVTASHSPSTYNGVKLIFAGQFASALTIAKLRQRLQHGDFISGTGDYREQSVLADYFDELEQDLTIARPLKLVIDCGFAAPALVAPQLLRDLGCELIALRCDLSDPRAGVDISNPADSTHLALLSEQVRAHRADLGLAFDGDGDCFGVIDSLGRFISADRILMLLAGDLLKRLPGSPIVFDVACSRHLSEFIQRQGGKPVMWKTGPALIREKRQELNAPLAGELGGHLMLADRWNGSDDAFYAAARMLEILALDSRPSAAVFDELPVGLSTPELIAPVAPGEELEILSVVLSNKNRLTGVKTITIDGLRVEADKGWGLVRAAHNEPALVFRFEADDEAMLNKLQELFRRLMKASAPKLQLPF